MMDATKIKVSLSQDKINLINNNYKYWKEAALKRAFDEKKANQLKDSATSSFF